MKENFAEIIREATNAATVAGDKWVAEHTKPAYAIYDADIYGNPRGECLGTMLDVCGFGYVRITDKRTAFAKYIKKTTGSHYIFLNTPYRGRQEWSLNEATAWAAYHVFKKHGITGITVYSNID